MIDGMKLVLQTANSEELKEAWMIAKVLMITNAKKETIIEELKKVVSRVANINLLSVIVTANIVYDTMESAVRYGIKVNASTLSELNFRYDAYSKELKPNVNIESEKTIRIAASICAQCSATESKYTIYCFSSCDPTAYTIQYDEVTESKVYFKTKEENTFYV